MELSNNALLKYSHELWAENWADPYRGSFETWIHPLAIYEVHEQNARMREILQEALDALEVSSPPESPIQQRHKAHARTIRNIKGILSDNATNGSVTA
jgi:hypothetical protein